MLEILGFVLETHANFVCSLSFSVFSSKWSWCYITICAVASDTQFEKHDNKWNPISQRPLTQKFFLVKLWLLWSGFHLDFTESEKGLLSDLFCHQLSLSLFLIHCLVVFCISSFLGQCIWWNPSSLIFYLGFQEITLPCFFSKPSARSFSVFFATMLFPLIVFLFHGSVLASPSSLCITFLTYPSSILSQNSHPLISRGLLDNWTRTF